MRRHHAQPPQGRKAARVSVLCRVREGSLILALATRHAASVGGTMGLSITQWTRATGPPDLGQGLRGAAGWFICISAGLYYDRLAMGFIAGMLA